METLVCFTRYCARVQKYTIRGIEALFLYRKLKSSLTEHHLKDFPAPTTTNPIFTTALSLCHIHNPPLLSPLFSGKESTGPFLYTEHFNFLYFKTTQGQLQPNSTVLAASRATGVRCEVSPSAALPCHLRAARLGRVKVLSASSARLNSARPCRGVRSSESYSYSR